MDDAPSTPGPISFLPGPSWWLTASDLGRASVEVAAWHAVRRALPRTDRGAGRPVLVLPGFLAGDRVTASLRAHLRSRGFHTHRWTLGVNHGFTDAILDGLVARLDELYARHGRPIAIVGWSLGGLMARWLAHLRPEAVERVVCLGSPWRPEVEQNRVTPAFRLAEQYWGFSDRTDDVIALLRRPVPVPSVAIYSPLDGLIPGDGCKQDVAAHCENVVVPASHCGLCHNPAAMIAVADRLEVPLDDSWRPFRWADAVAGGIGFGRRAPAAAPVPVAA